MIAAVRLLFRADAAFAKPEIYEYLEARSIGYAIRLRSNQVLQREIAHLLRDLPTNKRRHAAVGAPGGAYVVRSPASDIGTSW